MWQQKRKRKGEEREVKEGKARNKEIIEKGWLSKFFVWPPLQSFLGSHMNITLVEEIFTATFAVFTSRPKRN